MNKFFVFSGYITPDSDLEDSCYNIKEFYDEITLLDFVKEFKESIYDECDNIELRIFKGEEIFLEEKEVIKEWKLKK